MVNLDKNTIATKAVNLKRNRPDIYIGRGSIWGNPFEMKNYTDSERNRVCEKYEVYFWNTELSNKLNELVGKTLGCYCKPKRCHGDFLANLANNLDKLNEYRKVTILKEYIRRNKHSFNGVELKNFTVQVSSILVDYVAIDKQLCKIEKEIKMNRVNMSNIEVISHLDYLLAILNN